MRNLHLLQTAILLGFLAACQQQPAKPSQAVPTSPAAATIGETTIYESNIDDAIAALPENMQISRNDATLRARILKVLLRRQALSRHAEALHLDQDPLIHRRIVKARDDILIESLRQWKMRHLTEPKATTIEAYYHAHLADFTIPEQVHARHILLGNKKQAMDVLRQLRSGKDFSSLAAELSRDDGTKARGGDLNWFPRGVMVKPFEEAVFALDKPGQRAEAVKTRFGWHVIELLGKRPASRQSLEEATPEISGILKQQALSAWFDELISASGVRIINPEYRSTASVETGGTP